jgi:hypothetical protein
LRQESVIGIFKLPYFPSQAVQEERLSKLLITPTNAPEVCSRLRSLNMHVWIHRKYAHTCVHMCRHASTYTSNKITFSVTVKLPLYSLTSDHPGCQSEIQPGSFLII